MKYFENLNERQKEAVTTTEGPLIVLAGAGSGKTRMLTSRIAYLIDGMGVPAHHILAVTFTNKAAGEMKERVAHSLQIQFNDTPWSSGPWMGTPEIGTFHSVCMRILRREAHCTPFTRPFVIYDDSDQLSVVKGALEKLGIDALPLVIDEAQKSPAIFDALIKNSRSINRLKCDAIEPHELEPRIVDEKVGNTVITLEIRAWQLTALFLKKLQQRSSSNEDQQNSETPDRGRMRAGGCSHRKRHRHGDGRQESVKKRCDHSTVTLFARLRGLSMSVPFSTAIS